MKVGLLLDDWGIISGISDFFMKLINLIPQILYFIFTCMCAVVDFCQVLFRKMVGLDTYYIGNDQTAVAEESGDFVFGILRSIFFDGEHEAIRLVFWSIIILSCLLLFITTIAGILRTEYTPDKEKLNSKLPVIKNALKAVASFFLIPIACYFGLSVGNIVIRAIDSSTQVAITTTMLASVDGLDKWTYEQVVPADTDTGETSNIIKSSYYAYAIFNENIASDYVPISGILFRASCFNANRLRDSATFFDVINAPNNGYSTTNFNVFNQFDSANEAADCIDEVFMANAKLKEENYGSLNHSISEDLNIGLYMEHGTVKNFSRFNVGLVSYYYNLWKYDFIVGYIAVFFVAKIFINIVFGLALRTIMIIGMLFGLPLFLSVMPTDNGAAFGKWVKNFLSVILSAYFVLFAMNLYYIILPLINQFRFFPTGVGFKAANYLVSTMFTLVGIKAVQNLNEVFSRIIMEKNEFNAMAEGAKVNQAVTSDVKAGIAGVQKVAKLGVGAASLGVGAAAGVLGLAGKGLGGIAKAGGAVKRGVQLHNYKKSVNTNHNEALNQAQKEKHNELNSNATYKNARNASRQEARDEALRNHFENSDAKNRFPDQISSDGFDRWKATNESRDYLNSKQGKADVSKLFQSDYYKTKREVAYEKDPEIQNIRDKYSAKVNNENADYNARMGHINTINAQRQQDREAKKEARKQGLIKFAKGAINPSTYFSMAKHTGAFGFKMLGSEKKDNKK